ncbi:MAG TPA: diguanylate cyclase [Sediminispirochaeta sp.]|nr:diguanylate cyclase [Sediminispirochaeta sp.]
MGRGGVSAPAPRHRRPWRLHPRRENQEKIEKTHHSCSEGQFSVTMTFGVAAFSADLSADGIIKQADMALYSGKNRGRNRSILFGEPLD